MEIILDFIEVFSFLLIFFALLFLYIAIYLRSYFKLRLKGYDPILSTIVSFIPPVAFSLLFIWLAGGDLFQILINLLLILPILNFYIAKYIPSKSQRVYGKRLSHFPYKTIGNISIVLFIIVVIFSFVYLKPRFQPEFQYYKFLVTNLLLPFVALYAYFTGMYKVFNRFNIEEQLIDDLRKPVLYIRSFNQDFDIFFLGNIYMNKVSSQLLDDLLLFKKQGVIKGITFQQYFTKAFEDNLGILVGLGNPEDKVPFEGIITTYYSDNDWQETFSSWADKSVCIVTTPADTDGLLYELRTIRNNGWQEKFFIFTKPVRNPMYKYFYMPLLQWSRLVKPTNWVTLAKNLHQVGLFVQEQEPDPGSIISFDKNGEQILVTKGAINPLSYTLPLVKHLGSEYITVRS